MSQHNIPIAVVGGQILDQSAECMDGITGVHESLDELLVPLFEAIPGDRPDPVRYGKAVFDSEFDWPGGAGRFRSDPAFADPTISCGQGVKDCDQFRGHWDGVPTFIDHIVVQDLGAVWEESSDYLVGIVSPEPWGHAMFASTLHGANFASSSDRKHAHAYMYDFIMTSNPVF